MNEAVNITDKFANNKETADIVKVEGVTIPKNFYYVGGTKADGIVISDAKEDKNKYKAETEAGNSQIPGDDLVGNQFVWVPVKNIESFKTYEGYFWGEKDTLLSECKEPSPNGYDKESEEYNLMKLSVEKNQGFYVARYEAGKEKIGGVDTVVSKKGAEVWNFIKWGDSMTSIGTEGAVAKSKGMYTGKNGYDVTSTLIYGTQWDAIMAWIDPNYKTVSCSDDSFVKNSEGKGNFDEEKNTNKWKGTIASTGASDEYRVNNIYDLAGNVQEWTMEEYQTTNRVFRGADYTCEGANTPASIRNFYAPGENPMMYIGFRVAIYI